MEGENSAIWMQRTSKYKCFFNAWVCEGENERTQTYSIKQSTCLLKTNTHTGTPPRAPPWMQESKVHAHVNIPEPSSISSFRAPLTPPIHTHTLSSGPPGARDSVFGSHLGAARRSPGAHRWAASPRINATRSPIKSPYMCLSPCAASLFPPFPCHTSAHHPGCFKKQSQCEQVHRMTEGESLVTWVLFFYCFNNLFEFLLFLSTSDVFVSI